MRTKKSWAEKLADDKDLPRIITIAPHQTARWGTGTLVIPRPRDVDVLMRQVPKGKLTTVNDLRATLAQRHGATAGCPITTGIFAWIAAHAAEESAAAGRKRITPYWRTLKANGELNPKYPGGLEAHQAHLEAEGHTIITKGKRRLVANLTPRLHTF